ncbi:MAG: hypothetical protein J6V80_03390 [Clostridia bacterium]|nr:hypothetical protein [Clostridia bacterium]
MKRIYSEKDFKGYTCMSRVLSDLKLDIKDYWWLICDIEAYPIKKQYQDLIGDNYYLLLSTSELVNMLKDDDFQWVWAVFSAIPSTYEKEDILKFNLPYLEYFDEGQYNPYVDEPRIQHPYAELEIYAADSSYMFLISDDEELVDRFKKCYPRYIEK